MINPGQLNEGLCFSLLPPDSALFWSGKHSDLYAMNAIRSPSVRGQACHLPKSRTEAVIYSSVLPSGRCRWCHCKQAGFYSGLHDRCIPLRARWTSEYHQEVVFQGWESRPKLACICGSKPIALSWVTQDGGYFILYCSRDICLHWSFRCKACQKLQRNRTLTVCSFLFLDGIKSGIPTDTS